MDNNSSLSLFHTYVTSVSHTGGIWTQATSFIWFHEALYCSTAIVSVNSSIQFNLSQNAPSNVLPHCFTGLEAHAALGSVRWAGKQRLLGQWRRGDGNIWAERDAPHASGGRNRRRRHRLWRRVGLISRGAGRLLWSLPIAPHHYSLLSLSLTNLSCHHQLLLTCPAPY